MNAKYYILTDQESNTYGVVLLEDGAYHQLNNKIRAIMVDCFGHFRSLIWDSAFTFTLALNKNESREFYLTQTELL